MRTSRADRRKEIERERERMSGDPETQERIDYNNSSLTVPFMAMGALQNLPV